eukprot:m.55078 g.55078  ORF g.55078 m.55078 type:complete len:203 (-) comp13284_c0_seq2:676-1284(-)
MAADDPLRVWRTLLESLSEAHPEGAAIDGKLREALEAAALERHDAGSSGIDFAQIYTYITHLLSGSPGPKPLPPKELSVVALVLKDLAAEMQTLDTSGQREFLVKRLAVTQDAQAEQPEYSVYNPLLVPQNLLNPLATAAAAAATGSAASTRKASAAKSKAKPTKRKPAAKDAAPAPEAATSDPPAAPDQTSAPSATQQGGS